MKQLFAAVLAAVLVAGSSAQEAKQEAKKIEKPAAPQKKERPPVTLKVGDKAPELKASKWLQGDPVTALAGGKVHVVEFWATWCGPCIVMMPHMSDLQTQFKDKVTIVGYSAMDPNNTAEKVAEFVKKRGDNLKYTFAYADNRDTYEAWMTAAGQYGIPCCFVVGQDGVIAYIGHPMYLDMVLPKVVDGSWKADEGKAALEKVEKDVNAMFKSIQGEPEAGLKALAEFETKYPPLAHIPYFLGPKLNLMLKAKKFDEAKKFAEETLARATKQADPTAMQTVSGVLRGPAGRDNKELVTISVNAAEAALKVSGDKDARALLNAADAYFVAGNKDKAKEYATRAVTAAETESAAMKRFIGDQAKKYTEEKKD